MTKAKLNLLEKLFGAEIEDRVPLASKNKLFTALEAEGMVEQAERTLGKDRFGQIKVSGWVLTELGRYTYCQWAAEWEKKLLADAKKAQRERRKPK